MLASGDGPARRDLPGHFDLVVAHANKLIKKICDDATMVWDDANTFTDLRFALAS